MARSESIKLQKQLKDNSEDLQQEFLDIKQWEINMRRKDQEIQKTHVDSVLPPIRRRKVKKSESKSNRNTGKSKRIKGYDYSSWDKFDAETACKEIDKSDSDSVEEVMSKEELEKNHQLATDYKVQGNIFVKESEWDKAIACYSKAIKVFPYDAVFYANRALCHLKMDNLYSAEADSSAAIQLDDMYIKAYHRRATARIALKQYKEAKQDVEKILSFDSTNADAKSLLSQINAKLQGSKVSPIVVTKQPHSPLKKPENLIKHETVIDTSDKTSNTPKDPCIPEWVSEKDVAVVKITPKLPHLRSKEPMKRIIVKEADITKLDITKSNEQSTNAIKVEDEKRTTQPTNRNSISKKEVKFDLPPDTTVPPVPKTAVQFLIDWKRHKSTLIRYEYLKQLPPDGIHIIFQDSMESDIFSEIIQVLQLEFMKRREAVFKYILDLSKVKRFRALIMFITKADKEGLTALFDYCENVERKSKEEVTELRTVFQV